MGHTSCSGMDIERPQYVRCPDTSAVACSDPLEAKAQRPGPFYHIEQTTVKNRPFGCKLEPSTERTNIFHPRDKIGCSPESPPYPVNSSLPS